MRFPYERHASPDEKQALELIHALLKQCRSQLLMLVGKRQRIVKRIQKRVNGKRHAR